MIYNDTLTVVDVIDGGPSKVCERALKEIGLLLLMMKT